MSDIPYDMVRSQFELPFDFRDYQADTLNELAPKPHAGYYLDPGLGKTAVSSAAALYRRLFRLKHQTIVVIPPILFATWVRWFKLLPGVSFMCYRGTPKERKAMRFNADFIIMSLPIFKRDFDRLCDEFSNRDASVIVDEATSVKNSGSGNHEMVFSFTIDRDLMLLTGTPISSPADVYAYTKLLRTKRYRNLAHFENLHVEARDFWGSVTKWRGLDYLAESLSLNAVRILKEDVLDLPGVIYTPVFYELDAKHYALYRELAEEQLLEFKDGSKIDATATNRLYHALQQVVLNWDYFGDDPKLRSAGEELAEQILDEIGTGKLLIFANYRMTNRKLIKSLAKYGAVGAYGELTQKQQEANVQRFTADPKCRVFVANARSAGYGIDGLQQVCSDILILEEPTLPRDFHQAVARLDRLGQEKKVHVRIAIAEKTVQVRLHKQLIDKDHLVNRVQRGTQDLRDALYGN
jgi:SNF2 family DNA or RNA helicase